MGRLVTVLAVAAVALAAGVSAADAAYPIAHPPTYVQSGAGVFEWQIRTSSAGSSTGAVAYKLSTESVWHRCNKDLPARLSDIPEGAYSITFADDISLDWYNARGLLFSGFTQPCWDNPTTYAPQTTPTTAMLYVDATPPTVSEPSPIIAGLDMLVSVETSDAVSGVASIEWSTGDGASYSGKSWVRHTYLLAGTWTGSVTVVDQAGNRTTRPYTVTVAPSAPPTAAKQPPAAIPTPVPAADTTAPLLRVDAQSRQRLRTRRAAVVTVSCSERCSASATGVLTVGGRRHALRASSRELLADQPGSVRVALSSQAQQALSRASRRGRRPVAVIRVTVQDAVGNRASKTVSVSAV
ncbi:PKD domain-containing protein [Solirubrobacter ginsenosidimutans]|uniref:PKD domain-containing protein n=1 Tax=Solirubrobacter ginsenosidimutans TaxID=490573 RepID=A0A9X3MXI9_9ACTN|nr:PKD domain-containing protein [Solirubrobacter ginsenosidimutans]MDA0161288.1 PKD domain-containing protein [Solirubrobacter ginsenosidimutans]